MLLSLWSKTAAAAPIQPLAWELLCAAGAALKSKKKKKKEEEEERKRKVLLFSNHCSLREFLHLLGTTQILSPWRQIGQHPIPCTTLIFSNCFLLQQQWKTQLAKI